MAKNASGAAFLSSKKRAEERRVQREMGMSGSQDSLNKPEDVFEVQHHHLLTCLEKTTVSGRAASKCSLF